MAGAWPPMGTVLLVSVGLAGAALVPEGSSSLWGLVGDCRGGMRNSGLTSCL